MYQALVSCRLAIQHLMLGSGKISNHKNADCPAELIYPILYPFSNNQVGLCRQTSASVGFARRKHLDDLQLNNPRHTP